MIFLCNTSQKIFKVQAVEHSYHQWVIQLQKILLLALFIADRHVKFFDIEHLEEYCSVVKAHRVDPPEGISSI